MLQWSSCVSAQRQCTSVWCCFYEMACHSFFNATWECFHEPSESHGDILKWNVIKNPAKGIMSIVFIFVTNTIYTLWHDFFVMYFESRNRNKLIDLWYTLVTVKLLFTLLVCWTMNNTWLKIIYRVLYNMAYNFWVYWWQQNTKLSSLVMF